MKIKDMEKYTSAITMSDMEVFVYPELMYSLVLANIMSPNIWRWRQEETFKKISIMRQMTLKTLYQNKKVISMPAMPFGSGRHANCYCI